MSGTLHIIRTSNDTKALACIEAQVIEGTLSLLLIQDATHTKPISGVKTYILTGDEDKTDIQTDIHPITYDEMVELLFTHETVVVW